MMGTHCALIYIFHEELLSFTLREPQGAQVGTKSLLY